MCLLITCYFQKKHCSCIKNVIENNIEHIYQFNCFIEYTKVLLKFASCFFLLKFNIYFFIQIRKKFSLLKIISCSSTEFLMMNEHPFTWWKWWKLLFTSILIIQNEYALCMMVNLNLSIPMLWPCFFLFYLLSWAVFIILMNFPKYFHKPQKITTRNEKSSH